MAREFKQKEYLDHPGFLWTTADVALIVFLTAGIFTAAGAAMKSEFEAFRANTKPYICKP